jgi:hypothetical protein
MKTLYQSIVVVILTGIFCFSVADGAEPGPGKLDVMGMKGIPDGKYSVKLELKQLDGEAVGVELEAREGRISSSDESGRLGRIQGKSQFIGNGVFMVQLQGKGYMATQFWVFRADGSAAIKEIPDRGEKQLAVPVVKKG